MGKEHRRGLRSSPKSQRAFDLRIPEVPFWEMGLGPLEQDRVLRPKIVWLRTKSLPQPARCPLRHRQTVLMPLKALRLFLTEKTWRQPDRYPLRHHQKKRSSMWTTLQQPDHCPCHRHCHHPKRGS